MRIRSVAALVLLAFAGWQLGSAAYIHMKALLAQELLERAWQRTLDGKRNVRPWPWADTHPVARLRARAQRRDLIVLDGASGRSLAFGPAHVSGTALPGDLGSSTIAGHRDTHFRFLRGLRQGDALEIQRLDGATIRYEVTSLRIVDSRIARIALDGESNALKLVTCFPFDATRPGGPLRFEVTAQPASIASRVVSVAVRQRKLAEQTAESEVTILTKKVMT